MTKRVYINSQSEDGICHWDTRPVFRMYLDGITSVISWISAPDEHEIFADLPDFVKNRPLQIEIGDDGYFTVGYGAENTARGKILIEVLAALRMQLFERNITESIKA